MQRWLLSLNFVPPSVDKRRRRTEWLARYYLLSQYSTGVVRVPCSQENAPLLRPVFIIVEVRWSMSSMLRSLAGGVRVFVVVVDGASEKQTVD